MGRSHGDRSDPTDKVRVLKKQVEFLRREVARLEKELRKANHRLAEMHFPDEEVQEEPPKRKKGEGSRCSECGKGTMLAWTISTRSGDKTYLTCNTCGHRKPVR